MDFKGGASFWNDVMFSTKSNRFKGHTTIILSSKLTPLMEKHGIIIPRRFQYLAFKLSSIIRWG
jgi:hypothetical protein